MYAFFDKFGKKLLVVGAALLILAMLLPPTVGQFHGQGVANYGTLDGKPVDPTAVENSAVLLELLERVEIVSQSGQAQTLAESFGNELYVKLREDPRLYFLLLHEARQNGLAVSETDVNQLLRSDRTRIRMPNGGSSDFASAEQQNADYARTIEQAVRAFMTLQESLRHSTRAIKVSAPAVDQALARRAQEARIRVVGFDAAALESKVPAPSDAQLAEQFSKYANIAAGQPGPANPFGFGYRVPDRVRIDYVEIPLADIERVVIASQKPEAWEEEAYLAYLRDPSRFTPPATQPATTQATQPTTRPFTEAKEDVLKSLREPLIEQRRRAIAGRIQQQLSSDYQRVSESGPAGTQKIEEVTAFGVPVASYEYLQKIRDIIQKQFGVGIRVVRETALFSEGELALHPALGGARTEAAGNELPRTTASYLFTNLQPFQANEQPTQLKLYEPSKMLKSSAATFIVRVTAAETAHPAPAIDAVKDQVVKDVRRRLAFEQATAEADAALATARENGLDKAQGVETSGWFSARDFTIPGIDEKAVGSSGYLLIGPTFDLLAGVRSTEDLPVRGAIPLHSADRVCVVELFDLRSTLTSDETAIARLGMAAELQQTVWQQQNWIATFFDRDALFKRVGFTPAQPRQQEPAQPAVPPPARPFIPG